ncbi:hypothetical protein ILUMI_02497 [Ignelater luminosus]|uniref:receptor protein-tyrosine kinase n=1 Tax=Ignelater luminosus TaxID=2038154 RepID=A0A8K0GKS4_IGNLU|nr:hypothetical protein ILUMI_02497 [Ignelater luminosus]
MGACIYLLFTILVVYSHVHMFNANDLDIEQSMSEPSSVSPNNQDDDDNRDEVEKPGLDGKGPLEKAPYFTHKKKMSKIHIKPAGNMLNLKCKAGGHPTPNITWYKNNQIPTGRLGKVRFDHWSLILEDLITSDSGTYKCLVCNVLGCINFNYTVDVIDRFPSKPSIKAGYPQNVSALVNSTAVLECPQVVADLEPFIQWIKSSNFSTELINSDYIPKGIVLQTSATSPNPEILELSSVTRENEGWYSCVAANTLGITSASAYLKIVDTAGEGSRPQSRLLISFAGIAVCWLSVILLLR